MSDTSSSRFSSNVVCDCSCQVIDKTTVSSPGCEDDYAAVSILPDNWTPKHSGPTLANYLKQREQNHEKILEDMSSEFCRVNKEIDDKVREISEILVAHIQDNQVKIDCTVQECGTGQEEFTPQQRNEALKVIHNTYNNRIEDIAGFIQSALKLERERADKLRHLMRDHFNRLVAVGHKTPKDLLHDFDDRIYDVNQQLLSNNRAYSELTGALKAEADENVVKARSTLNQLCLGVITAYRCQSARRSSTRGTPEQRSASATFKRETSEPTIKKEIKNAQEELKKCVMHLLEVYRQAVMNIFSGFSSKLQDLHNSLTTFNYDQISKCNPTCYKLEDAVENVLMRISTSFHTKLSIFNKSQEFIELTQNEIFSVEKSLSCLGECLRDTYTILHDAGHLWDAHMLRSALAQKLTIAAVEDLLTNNDALQLANEIGFNQVLEQMVSSPDEEKLNGFYATLNMMLDSTANMYQNHNTAEINRLEEFMKLPPAMATTLLAEFNCFLTKHPSVPPEATAFNSPVYRAPSGDISKELSLPHMVLQTELQMAALMNWRNGFLETFQNNMCTVPDELVHQAQLWVNERSTALHMRNSLKQVSHNVRRERVKAAYDSRLTELRQHESRLNSHLNALKDLFMTLPEEASEYLSLDAPELYPLRDWLVHIDEDMQRILNDPAVKPENRKLKMRSYLPRLAKYKELFDNSLNEQMYEYKTKMIHKIQNARIANVRFADKVKLFSEGGRYASQEAVKAFAAFHKMADLLENCEPRFLEALHSREVQLFALAEQEILPIQKTVCEFLKIKLVEKGKDKDKGKGKDKQKKK